jgi:hypothetical protein
VGWNSEGDGNGWVFALGKAFRMIVDWVCVFWRERGGRKKEVSELRLDYFQEDGRRR